MIVATIQEVNEISDGCCPCALPSCGEPRRECESITVDVSCAFDLPTHEDLLPDDACKKFRKKVVDWDVTVSDPDYRWGGGLDYTGTDYYRTTSATTWDAIKSGEICDERLQACSETYTRSIDVEYDGDTIVFEQNGSGSLDENGDVVGTITTDQTGPHGATSSSESVYFGTPRNFTPDNTWSCSGLTFTKTDVEGNATTTITVTYIPYDAEDLIENLAELEFPDDANGDDCSGTIEVDPECEGSILSATKARYRFAPPHGFGAETPPRTYYEAQWDEVFFPEDPEATPSLVASRSWLWNGNTEDPWSEWFTIEPPAEPGEIRVVNLMVRCWKSTRLGNKPAAFGETYTPPTP